MRAAFRVSLTAFVLTAALACETEPYRTMEVESCLDSPAACPAGFACSSAGICVPGGWADAAATTGKGDSGGSARADGGGGGNTGTRSATATSSSFGLPTSTATGVFTGPATGGKTGTETAGKTGTEIAGKTGTETAGRTGTETATVPSHSTKTTVATATSSATMPGLLCASGVKNKEVCLPHADQPCFFACGPEKKGQKACVCNPATKVWDCPACTFASGYDYSCYKIPTPPPPCGPAGTTVTSGSACTVPPCQTCGGVGGYQSSSGALKDGYCVCGTSGKWSCASMKEWPCPSGQGCR